MYFLLGHMYLLTICKYIFIFLNGRVTVYDEGLAENKIVRHLSLWCLFSVQDAGRDGRWPAVLRHVESEAGPTPQRPVYDYSWAGGPDV
jgi:hypothetical protein